MSVKRSRDGDALPLPARQPSDLPPRRQGSAVDEFTPVTLRIRYNFLIDDQQRNSCSSSAIRWLVASSSVITGGTAGRQRRRLNNRHA